MNRGYATVLYAGECRGCARSISHTARVNVETARATAYRWVRCECETINYLEQTDSGPTLADNPVDK